MQPESDISREVLLNRLRDPKTYIETFCKIKGKTPGLIPFKLNEAQKDLYNNLRKSSRVIILKARQIGFSTAATAWLYHKTIATPGTTTAIIGYNQELTTELLDKIKIFMRSTPEDIRPQVQYNSKYEITFPVIDSKILVLPSTETVGRGYTLHNVLCTELSSWEKADEKMLSIESAVPSSGKIIVESTPRGVGNLYHRMWMAKDNGYAKLEYGWWWLYTEDEIEAIRKRINDPMKFAQEYELAFLTSGRPVFNARMVQQLKSKCAKVGDILKDDDGTLHIVTEDQDGLRTYKKPRLGKKYVVGADVAEGVTGGDYSVAVVFDRETGEEVAFWRGHIAPDKFGALLNKIGRLYNDALMVVEINNHGLTTVTALKNLLYPQMYFRRATFDGVATKWSDRLGWKTTSVTRPLMIDDFNEALRDGGLHLRSEELVDEMFTFVYDGGSNMVCLSGFHDDCIFAASVCFQGFKSVPLQDMDQINYEDHLPVSGAY